MSHKVNAKAIGAFTITAIVLFIAGLLTFGSGDWFRAEYEVEMVFTGSVKGLTPGSPITFRGVRIGEVKEIKLEFVDEGGDIIIRVVGVLVQGEDSRFANRKQLYDFLEAQIKKGLRAQLVAQSLVTGRLQIQLEYFPLQEGYSKVDGNDNLDIPTVPTDFEVVTENIKNVVGQLDDIPLAQIANNLNTTLQGLSQRINTKQTDETLHQMNASLKELNTLLSAMNQERERFFAQYYITSDAFQTMAKNVTEASQRSMRLMQKMDDALKDIDGTLDQALSTMRTVEQLIEPGSELRVRAIKVLDSLERTSEQFRQLGETIERNPEAILTGRKR